MAITVDRGGMTANHWYESGIKAKTQVVGQDLKIRFHLDSKGGGQTDVCVNIGRASYQQLLELMLQCDFEHTVNSFGQSLVRRQASSGT
jgi:hypothetical protein